MKRALPWLVAVMAYVGPPVWAYFEIERDAVAQKAARGWACGNAALGIVLLACIASSVLSVTAAGIRGWSVGWWTAASLSMRSVEGSVLLFPLLFSIGFAVYLFSL